MIARTQLAVLDYNSRPGEQALTIDGTPRYKQSFSKITQNWVVKKVSAKGNRQFIQQLLEQTYASKPDAALSDLPQIANVPKNIAPWEKPEKEDAIQHKISRFTTSTPK